MVFSCHFSRLSYRFKFLSSPAWFINTNRRCYLCSNTPDASKTTEPSSLLRELTRQITFSGPVTVHDYMRIALTHPRHGFYTTRESIGVAGAFTTSPEISQIYGELIAVWIIAQWTQRGSARTLRIVELGPGRGTLTADIARVMAQFGYVDQISFHLVEISPKLTELQARNICGDDHNNNNNIENDHEDEHDVLYRRTKYGQSIKWYRSLNDIPRRWNDNDNPDDDDCDGRDYTIFVANEYFDAFPIHKFVRTVGDKWRELLIDIDSLSESSPKLRWIRANQPTPASMLFASPPPLQICGDHYEFSPQTSVQIEQIVRRLSDMQNGCLLINDYGFDPTIAGIRSDTIIKRDTFRAYRSHQLCDPLDDPGSADLTADVDFGAIRRAVEGAGGTAYGAISQRKFLTKLGIQLRLERLLRSIPDRANRLQLISGVRMLIEDMGERFMVMIVCGDRKKRCTKSSPEEDYVPIAFEDESEPNEDLSRKKT